MKESRHYHDTAHLMVCGNEPWLEMGGSHGHEGDDVELRLMWGHNMRADGLARRKGLSAFVVYPGGSREELAVAAGSGQFHVLRSILRWTAFIMRWPGTWAAMCWTGRVSISGVPAGSIRRRPKPFYIFSLPSV